MVSGKIPCGKEKFLLQLENVLCSNLTFVFSEDLPDDEESEEERRGSHVTCKDLIIDHATQLQVSVLTSEGTGEGIIE